MQAVNWALSVGSSLGSMGWEIFREKISRTVLCLVIFVPRKQRIFRVNGNA